MFESTTIFVGWLTRENETLRAVVRWSHRLIHRVTSVADAPLSASLEEPQIFTWAETLEEWDPGAVAAPLELHFEICHLTQRLYELGQSLLPQVTSSPIFILYEML